MLANFLNRIITHELYSWAKRALGSDVPQSDDEQTVNAALTCFQKAATDPFGLSSEWMMKRKAFKAAFGNGQYKARVDGLLKGKKGKQGPRYVRN